MGFVFKMVLPAVKEETHLSKSKKEMTSKQLKRLRKKRRRAKKRKRLKGRT